MKGIDLTGIKAAEFILKGKGTKGDVIVGWIKRKK